MALLAALVAGEGIGFARRYLAVVPQSERLPRPAWVNALPPADDPAAPYRVAPLGRHTLPAGWTARLGLQSVAGYDPWNLRHYLQYADILQHGRPEGGARVWLDLERIQRRDLLDRLNARYLISSSALADMPGLRLVGRFSDQPSFVFYQGMIALPLWVYENQQAAPRVSWAGERVAARDEAAMLDAVLREDLARTTVILGGPEDAPADLASPEDALRLVSWAPGRLSIETRSLGPRLVRLSEVWHPGWRARLDDRDVAVLRADLALMALAVPAGAHRWELRFQPPGETLGLWISALSAVALLAVGLVVGRLRRRNARGRPS
jgi:hypothetical protein